MKILIIYYSQSGNTKRMAQLVAEGVKSQALTAELKEVQKIKAKELLGFDGIIIGSPTYYGGMAYQIKRLFDESVQFHGELAGKVGAAFSSSANVGGGNETTILDIINAMLIHGMVVQGDASGDHYGPVAIGEPDTRSSKQCRRLGQQVARLVKRLSGKSEI